MQDNALAGREDNVISEEDAVIATNDPEVN